MEACENQITKTADLDLNTIANSGQLHVQRQTGLHNIVADMCQR